MQLLYAMDITAGTVSQCIDGVLNSQEISSEMKRYGMTLVDLVQEHRVALDEDIGALSQAGIFSRFAKLDGLFCWWRWWELRVSERLLPSKVAIQEAVQIANKYCTDESFRFVNGILNTICENRGMIIKTKHTQRSGLP
jgi:N utilization substance protein B